MLIKKHSILFLFVFCTHFSFCQAWQQISDFPSDERDDGTCFVIGNKAYCGTGLKVGSLESNDMYSFDMNTETWTTIAPLATGAERQYASGFSYSHLGFIFGGIDGANYMNDLYCYDTTNNSWQPKTALPSAGRMGASCFVIDSIAYIIGGRTATGSSDIVGG